MICTAGGRAYGHRIWVWLDVRVGVVYKGFPRWDAHQRCSTYSKQSEYYCSWGVSKFQIGGCLWFVFNRRRKFAVSREYLAECKISSRFSKIDFLRRIKCTPSFLFYFGLLNSMVVDEDNFWVMNESRFVFILGNGDGKYYVRSRIQCLRTTLAHVQFSTIDFWSSRLIIYIRGYSLYLSFSLLNFRQMFQRYSPRMDSNHEHTKSPRVAWITNN